MTAVVITNLRPSKHEMSQSYPELCFKSFFQMWKNSRSSKTKTASALICRKNKSSERLGHFCPRDTPACCVLPMRCKHSVQNTLSTRNNMHDNRQNPRLQRLTRPHWAFPEMRNLLCTQPMVPMGSGTATLENESFRRFTRPLAFINLRGAH